MRTVQRQYRIGISRTFSGLPTNGREAGIAGQGPWNSQTGARIGSDTSGREVMGTEPSSRRRR